MGAMFLSGKTALVTGASRGLGRAIAYRLSQDGASVAINYSQRRDGAESLASEVRNSGGKAMICQCDVADSRQVSKMVDSISAELGPIDILVNNAAILHRADLEQYDQGQLEEMQRVNVGGAINTTVAVVESMKQRRFGRIVNLTSIAANGSSLPGTTFYASTKAAIILLTRRFAMDLGSFGITVNAIAPGFVATDMTTDALAQVGLQGMIDRVVGATMVRRLGKPEDIAHAVAFLSSAESGFITAQTLTVDGGRMDYIAHP
jgi:3-oxoacyl-[acyl-carrier protein] reductase